jgi:flagellar basal-body rod protein FlgF
MNSGMYSALSGDVNMMDKLDVVANNLANVNTVGFKKDRLYFSKALDTASQSLNGGALTDNAIISQTGMFTDYSAGSIQKTDNTFHMALDGDGFFAVKTPQGIAYTRQGNFIRDKNGMLTTIDGYPVQARGGGDISIPAGNVQVDATGKVMVDATAAGSIDVVDFPKPYQLNKINGTMFVPANSQVTPQAATKTSVMQGYLENSNVNAISEMMQIIDCSRSFESCQRVIKSYDDMSGKAIQLGAPA